jgi:tetratricopeptide (TPR) repeat protein
MHTKRAAEGIAECEHALELNRNLASAHAMIGLGRVYIGRADETEAHVTEALRLSPRDTLAYQWMSNAGMAKNYLGRWDEAVAWFRRSVEANRNNPYAYFRLAAALGSLGDSTRRVPPSRRVSRSTRPSPSPGTAPSGRR